MTQVVDLERLTPAEYRARYEALQAEARALAAAPPAVPPPAEMAKHATRGG